MTNYIRMIIILLHLGQEKEKKGRGVIARVTEHRQKKEKKTIIILL
ncbi:MAG: hypothetical protein NZ901_01415 [Geminocystis sp.]|nr:hypothetical protein [Geminocystis sp.]